jgi:hypothetical protein
MLAQLTANITQPTSFVELDVRATTVPWTISKHRSGDVRAGGQHSVHFQDTTFHSMLCKLLSRKWCPDNACSWLPCPLNNFCVVERTQGTHLPQGKASLEPSRFPGTLGNKIILRAGPYNIMGPSTPPGHSPGFQDSIYTCLFIKHPTASQLLLWCSWLGGGRGTWCIKVQSGFWISRFFRFFYFPTKRGKLNALHRFTMCKPILAQIVMHFKNIGVRAPLLQ